MKYLNKSESRFLESLAKYKFLTNQQIEDLGIRKGAENVRSFTRKFFNDPTYSNLTARLCPGVRPQGGKIPHLYYLTPQGAKFIEEHFGVDPGSIKFPAPQSIISFRDYDHRVSTIDFFIHLNKWAEEQGFEVLFTDAYFDKTGASRGTEKLRAKTKIDLDEGYIIADGATMIDTGERRHLCLLEVYNGMDTKRVHGQLLKHTTAIAEGSPSVKYNFDRSNFVAVVFDTEEAKTAVMRRIREDAHFKEFLRHFRFKTIADFKKSFYDDWSLFDGSKVNFI